MGVVFRARDAALGRDVALKALRQATAEHVYVLKHEFRGLARLSHRNLVELYELFTIDGSCFFTMELLDGRSFTERFAEARCAGWAPPDVAALRDCVAQLAAGLGALHAAQQAHRDIKPSNVLVTRDDRVALLDFGLAAPLREGPLHAPPSGMYGTLNYVAPEQIFGEPATVASDCYSVGVTLFEVLTGRVPCDGAVADLVAAKQAYPPPRASRVARGVPRWLDEAVCRLLDPWPERRLDLAGLRALLDGDGRDATASTVAPRPRGASPSAPRPFVGRDRELAALHEAFAAARDGAPGAVEIRGPSGIGKSDLVERFFRELEASDQAIVLRGRCHPQESVPFKALDPIVDELSRHLSARADLALSAPDAPRARALLRLFPVLGRLPALAEAAEAAGEGAAVEDPPQLRRLGIQALRELLLAVGAHRPLVLWIDDVQWGDRDSAPVLREVLRAPQAPRALLIASYRPADARDSALLEALGELARDGDLARRRIDLGPLPSDEAFLLAQQLLEGSAAHADPALARALVDEAEGSPFFIGELVQHLALAGRSARDARPPAVAELTRVRLDALAADARAVVELVAVAGGPIEAALVLDAAGLGAAGRPLLFRMCNQSLLREGEARGARPETLETYHDRVRETLLAGLVPDGLRARHRQLAEALVTRASADPEALMRHYLGAGDEPQAAEHARRAAEQAAAALAFEHATELYDTAFRLRGGRDEDWPLRAARAAALGAAGRGASAGATYEEAAGRAARLSLDAETTAALSTNAAEQYRYAGLLGEGLRVLRGVMGELEVSIPATPRAARRSSLGLRLRFFLRGVRAEPRAAELASRRELLRLDAMWKAARGTAMLDHTLGDVLALRHLLGALELGEPSRMVRALCMEAASEATVGGRWLRRRSERLIAAAAGLAAKTGEPYDEAVVLVHRAATALVAARFADCAEHCRQAEAIFRTRCAGVAYELNIVHSFHSGALALLGRLRELDALTATYLDEAQLRGDRYALAFFRSGDLVLLPLPLARGDAALALRQVDESLVGIPDDHFNSFHFYHLLGATRVELYAGDAERACARMAKAWPALRAGGFLQLESLGTVLHYLYGCAALAAAAAREARPAAPPARELHRTIAAAERFLRRVTIPSGAPLGAVLRAGLHGLRRDRPSQRRVLAEAIAGCDAVGMALHREALRLQLALLEDGADEQRAALDWMAAQGVREPYSMARCIAPVAEMHAAARPH